MTKVPLPYPAWNYTDRTVRISLMRITGHSSASVFQAVLLAAALSCSLSLSCCHREPGATTTPPPPTPQEDVNPPETTLTKFPAEKFSINKVTFEWTGTDDTTPVTELTFSCFLEGYDADYSAFTIDTSKSYTGLPDGKYTFYVRARDLAGNIDPTPATVTFVIESPKAEPDKGTAAVPIPSPLLIIPGSDVTRIAVTYDNIVYALDATNSRLFKSEPGGVGWKDISGALGATPAWTDLAVAPDDHNIIAVVTNSGREVYVSTNGGANFGGTALGNKLSPGEQVTCIAISPRYGNNRWEIAVGTSTGSGGGRVWINQVAGFTEGWADMSSGATGWLPPPITGADVFAIRYSPNFAMDSTLLAIVATTPPGDGTYLYAGSRDLGGTTTQWNAFSGYPVEVCQSGQNSPGTPLRYADIALPADYSGATPWHRHAYICWSDNPPGTIDSGNPNDGVYRIDDTICYRIFSGPDIICSLAHYGTFSRGKLLAGAVSSTQTEIFRGPQTYFTADPYSSCPSWQKSLKPPTGPGQARVAWSPDGNIAYCGTSSASGGHHDQSALSVSTNNGLTWNQIGLIDL